MPVIQPSAQTVPLLKGVVLALKTMDKDVRNDITRTARSVISPEWVKAVEAKTAGMPLIDQRVLGKGARVTGGNPVRLVASTSKRALSGGLVPNDNSRGFEFGTDQRDKTSTYARTYPGGKRHQVTRRAGRHLPNRVRTGRAVFPAVAEVLPRFTSLWVQIVVRKIHEAAEKR